VLCITGACTDDTNKDASEPIIRNPVNQSKRDFQVYVDRFAVEAAKREIEIDIRTLTVVFSDTLNFYCG